MNLVDSSGWLAYFADEPNAGRSGSYDCERTDIRGVGSAN